MATEAQIQQLWQDIIRLEERIDYCCRDIVFWDFRVRIRDKYGNIQSDYLDNRTTGIMRRGKNFTMKLPIAPIPKYEGELEGNATVTNYVDEDNKKCILDGTTHTLINGLCPILYRGSEGNYYDLSTRKTQPGLSFLRMAGTNIFGTFTVHRVDENGNEGNFNAAANSGTNYNGNVILENTHFARVENNEIYVDVNEPIQENQRINIQTSSSDGMGKPYGIIYYLDVRDVTLGV